MSLKNILKFVIIYILTFEAKLVLKKYKPRIIAITGSVGKTSTKDAIYSVLEKKYYIRKSDKSFNGDIGVPLTILGLHNGWFSPLFWFKNCVKGLLLIIFNDPYPKVLVLEIGADKPKEIEKITRWVRPNISIGTRFPKIPVHVEFFSSAQAVIDEDALVLKAVIKEGTVIINYDDPEMVAFQPALSQEILTYGLQEGADVLGTNVEVLLSEKSGFPVGITFNVSYKGESVPVIFRGALGLQHVYPLLGAIAVGSKEGMGLVEIVAQLSKHTSPPGRMHLIEGQHDSLIIDDTYNASPVAMEQAIKVTGDLLPIGNGKRIFALGDMLELGSFASSEHLKIGEQAGKVCDILVTVGIRSRGIAEGAVKVGMPESAILQFDDSKKAGQYLKEIVSKGDIVLIKGSQSIRMERAVEAIMAHTEDKEKLLVRQDPMWLKK
jgi:UDP-N-acetylmuramyl pentapeptide synthase